MNNVTIQNLEIYTNNPNSIYLYNCSNCEITKVKTNQDTHLVYSNFNTIIDNYLTINLDDSNNNTITRNNIIDVGLLSLIQTFASETISIALFHWKSNKALLLG